MADYRATSGQSVASLQAASEGFRFDLGSRQLWRGDTEIKVTPRALALLAVLAERPMQVVSKQELLDRVWEGKAVGDDALTSCMQELRRALGDDPHNPRFIETRHRRGYRWLVLAAPASAQTFARDEPLSLELPDKPSIAVLPFHNLTGDDGQQYFVDGLVEDVIGALSRIRRLSVTSRNSSFTFRGRDVDVKQVGQELGVRYVLEGSVRKSGDRIRVASQLIVAATRAHLWSERFDSDACNIFELQDQMTSRIVGALAPHLDRAEMERALHKPTARLDAYDVYLRGRASVFPSTRERTEQALSLYRRAIELDPNFAIAYARAAALYTRLKANRWLTPADVSEAERLARRAWELDQNDSIAVECAGMTLALVVGDLEAGAVFIERALELNPNVANHWASSGWINLWLGRGDLAIDHFQRAIRFSPANPWFPQWETGAAFGHFMASRFGEASAWAGRALQKEPEAHNSLRVGAAAAAMAGRIEEANRFCARLRAVDPTLSLSNFWEAMGPYRDPRHLALLAEGLRKAGLPG
jgi:TolB-like protein/Tfp pilus assembly protein PilF